MKAIVATVDSDGAFVKEIEEPEPEPGEVKVKTKRVGVDGTDLEVIGDVEGRKPAGSDFIVLGHEAVGEVVDGTGTEFEEGDIVVPMVRRPTSNRSEYFDVERPDMAPMGDFVERGIINAHGYMSEYFVSEPEYLVKIPDSLEDEGFLVEPISITEKALDQFNAIQQNRSWYDADSVLILGNGRLGLLTAIMMADDFTVTVYSRKPVTAASSKLVEEVGGEYISAQDEDLSDIGEFDFVIETTGYSPIFIEGVENVGPHGVYSILGIPETKREYEVDIAELQKTLVFQNKSIIGSVNSHRPHFEDAIETLESLPADVLSKYVSTYVPVEDAPEAFTTETIKSVVVF